MEHLSTSSSRNALLLALEPALADLRRQTLMVVEHIESLKRENEELNGDNARLREQIEDLTKQLSETKEQFHDMQERPLTSLSLEERDGVVILSRTEKETLERQIDTLLERITAHLGS